MNKTLKRFLRSKGSATLELTIIFPLILFLLLAIIFFALFIYQKMVAMDTSVYTARERAATWNNSFKDIETGSLWGSTNNDGLYWRITGDASSSELVDKKLSAANYYAQSMMNAHLLQPQQSGSLTIAYKNTVIKRTVITSSGAFADVSEPVEFIRNFGLGKEYFNELISYLKTFGRKPQEEDKLAVVASKKSNVYGQKIYHYPGCKHIGKIKQENLRQFQSEDLAVKEGFNLCIDCANSRLGAGSSQNNNKPKNITTRFKN